VAPVGGIPRSQFHRYGPWVLVGLAAVGALIAESFRRHDINRVDVIFFCALVPSIILHEISHGVVALWCGDTTAKDARRLSLNPIRHIDIFGTILVPLILVAWGGPAFGWAKPVPVNIGRLRHPRNQAVLVGLAGPATNIVLALIAGFALRLLSPPGHLYAFLPQGFGILDYNQWPLGDLILFLFGEVNIFLAVFNLIPLPPLDGSSVIERLLPASLMPGYYSIRQFSLVLVLALVYIDHGAALDGLFSHALSYWENVVFR
jgi:Zn-dependent protease